MRYNISDTAMMSTTGSNFDRKVCFETTDLLFDCYDKFNESEGI